MGTVTKTVGTSSRQYSTLAAAYASVPANLVTDGNSYVLDCYNDSEFSSASTLLAVSGNTTDSTHTLTIKAASGQGWNANASVQTNRVDYVAANGVAIKLTSGYATAITCDVANVFFDGLQISAVTSPARGFVSTSSANGTISNSIVKAAPALTFAPLELISGSTAAKAINCWIISATSTACTGIRLSSSSLAINCTIVRPSNYTAGGPQADSTYGTAVLRNCAFFGFTSGAGGTGSYNADGHNVTDFTSAAGSTGNLTSKTFANQFAQSSDASVLDLKIVTGSDCKDAGVTDTTDIPGATDAVGTSRPQGTAWDVGAWEFVSGGGGATFIPGWANGATRSIGSVF